MGNKKRLFDSIDIDLLKFQVISTVIILIVYSVSLYFSSGYYYFDTWAIVITYYVAILGLFAAILQLAEGEQSYLGIFFLLFAIFICVPIYYGKFFVISFCLVTLMAIWASAVLSYDWGISKARTVCYTLIQAFVMFCGFILIRCLIMSMSPSPPLPITPLSLF